MTNTWQPYSTMPDGVSVDIWIKSRDHSSYNRRAVNVVRVVDTFFGANLPESKYGEYISHWMHQPEPPKD